MCLGQSFPTHYCGRGGLFKFFFLQNWQNTLLACFVHIKQTIFCQLQFSAPPKMEGILSFKIVSEKGSAALCWQQSANYSSPSEVDICHQVMRPGNPPHLLSSHRLLTKNKKYKKQQQQIREPVKNYLADFFPLRGRPFTALFAITCHFLCLFHPSWSSVVCLLHYRWDLLVIF